MTEKPCQDCRNKMECLERMRMSLNVFCETEKNERFESEIPSPAEFHNQEFLDTGIN